MGTKRKIWVVKVGSQVLTAGGPILVRDWMGQVSRIQKKHPIDFVWVSSGAIAIAEERTQFSGKERTLAQKQALSAIGQPIIMDLYNISLSAWGELGSQVLLSSSDLQHPERRKNFLNTIRELLSWRIIPILNENDAVATEEIKFGDNDSLSAQVAIALKAEKLIIMSNVEGLYSSNPQNNPRASLIKEVETIDDHFLSMAPKSSKSQSGTGGMHSKLLAAQEAANEGIPTYLIKGDCAQSLNSLFDKDFEGTLIHGKSTKRTKK